jgi:hypothetical protein
MFSLTVRANHTVPPPPQARVGPYAHEHVESLWMMLLIVCRGVGTGGGGRDAKFSEDTKSALSPVAKCPLSS